MFAMVAEGRRSGRWQAAAVQKSSTVDRILMNERSNDKLCSELMPGRAIPLCKNSSDVVMSPAVMEHCRHCQAPFSAMWLLHSGKID